jgi:hypothetical protein
MPKMHVSAVHPPSYPPNDDTRVMLWASRSNKNNRDDVVKVKRVKVPMMNGFMRWEASVVHHDGSPRGATLKPHVDE